MTLRVWAYIEKYGITEQDYKDILKSDPLATGLVDPDLKRYQPSTQFMYTPPSPCDSTPDVQNVTFTTKNVSSSEQVATDTYSVDVSHYDAIGADAAVGELKGRLTENGKWTWQTQTSQGSSQSNSNGVSMSVGGPPCHSNKPPLMQAYLDKVYGTYAFREVQGTVALQGNVPPQATGTPSSLVSIQDAKGQLTEIYPNAKGEWVAVGDLRFPLTVTAKGHIKTITALPPDRKIDFGAN
jgi:hypothetical protein